MRFDGTLKSWDAERGFGFIVPRQGGQDIFVHASALPRDAHQPRVGETLSFEVETTADGKRAVRVRRPVRPAAAATPPVRTTRPAAPEARPSAGWGQPLVALCIVAAVLWYGYEQYQHQTRLQVLPHAVPVQAEEAPTEPVPAVGSFSCDGRQYCSQMTSCAEAKFFLQHCPGVQMDGNRDGVPCEQQWCKAPWSP